MTDNAANETALDAVMRRIKKLLAIAEDSRGDPHECAAAARMAESIMRKYQIEHADVIEKEIKAAGIEAFGTAECGSTMNPEGASKNASAWAGWLAISVARLHDAQVRYGFTSKYGKTLRFQGYKADVEVCRYMYVFIVNSMVAASKQYLAENRWAGKRESEAFRSGYVAAVVSKLNEMLREKTAEMQAASSSRSLVVVKANAVAQHFGKVRYGTGRSRSYQAEAFASGREAGSKLDVGRRGIGAASSSTAGLLR